MQSARGFSWPRRGRPRCSVPAGFLCAAVLAMCAPNAGCFYPADALLGQRGVQWRVASYCARHGRRADGVTMMMDPSVVPDAAVYLSVAGSLTGASPLILMDKNTANLAIGAVSGMVAAAVVYPIDTAKTRIQTLTGGDGAAPPNTLQMIQRIVKTDGMLALYQGLLPVMVLSAPESAVQLTVFQLSQSALSGFDSSIVKATVAGMIAGCATLVVTNPLDVLKISAQSNRGPPKPMLQLVKELGPKGLFRGWQATLLRDIPFAGLYFPLYCQVKSLLAPLLPNPLASALLAGLAAGMFAAGATTPCDVIKTKLQAPTPSPAPASELGGEAHGGVVATAKSLYAQKGWRGFFSGFDARVSRNAPAQGVSLCVFESLQLVFRENAVKFGTVKVAVSDDVTGVKYFRDMADRVLGSSAASTSQAAQEPSGFVAGVMSDPLASAAASSSGEFAEVAGGSGQAAMASSLGKATGVVASMDLDLAWQTPAAIAAALSQDLVGSVVVPVWQCGGVIGDVVDSCINQGVAQF